MVKVWKPVSLELVASCSMPAQVLRVAPLKHRQARPQLAQAVPCKFQVGVHPWLKAVTLALRLPALMRRVARC